MAVKLVLTEKFSVFEAMPTPVVVHIKHCGS